MLKSTFSGKLSVNSIDLIRFNVPLDIV